MKFEKGNKLGGRTKGSSNKVNQPIRDNFLQLLETNMKQMQSDLNALEPKDRLKILLDFASFCIPKLKAIEIEQTNINEQPYVELTAKEVEIIVKELEEYY